MIAFDLDQVANRREQLLFGLILLAFLVFFFRFLSLPQSVKIEAAKSQKEALHSEKEALTSFLASTPSLQKGETLSRKKGIKMKILFDEVKGVYQDAITLLAQLTDPLFLGGINVEKMNFQPTVADRGFSKTDFSITVLGSFVDVIQYLERLEQFPALFSLEQISLRSTEMQPQVLETEIQGRFFQLGTTPPLNPTVSEKVSQVGGTP
jgi:Tfp pilus assembly protein PilO